MKLKKRITIETKTSSAVVFLFENASQKKLSGFLLIRSGALMNLSGEENKK